MWANQLLSKIVLTYEAQSKKDENLHGETVDTVRRLTAYNSTTSFSRRNAVLNMKILIFK